MPWLVLAAALALAATDAARFLEDPAALFDGLAHDRNHHLLRAQRLAADLLEGDVIGWLRDFDRSRLWPPLHAVLASIPLALTRLDYRVAVLPSLLGFVATAVLAFLCARRASGQKAAARDLAGIIAFAFVAASPAHHRFATDVMLESLGAALTLGCLYFFLVRSEAGSADAARASRGLAICLSLLLVEKYNYYVLTVVGLALAALQATVPRERAEIRGFVRRLAVGLPREARHPLVLLGLGLWIVAGVVALTGGGRFQLFGTAVSVHNPFNLIHFGYLAIFLRVLWRAPLREAISRLPPGSQQIVTWHLVPVAIWFALPRRLGYFLHHVSPANTPVDSPTLFERWAEYARAFGADYHATIWGAALALALALVAAQGFRKLGPAGRACAIFAAVVAGATAFHPNGQSRFLMSWLAVVWVLAGVGAARVAAGRPLLAVAGVLGIGALVAGYTGVALLGGSAEPPRAAPSALSAVDVGTARVAVVANHPAEELIEWRFVALGGSREDLSVYTPRRRQTRADREAHFRKWLGERDATTLVFLDVDASSPWHAPGFAIYEELTEFVRAQRSFPHPTGKQTAGPGVTRQIFSR